jgi:hypothetical protein
MSLSTQSANLVRQKTYMINRNPGVFYALKALFLHLACNKNNPDLQLVNIDGTSLASDGGAAADQVIANVACTLYAIYLLKRGSVATSFKMNDSATATVGDGTDTGPNFVVTTLAEEDLFLLPSGHAMANGIAISEDTTQTGDTATLKANRIDGFFIISA